MSSFADMMTRLRVERVLRVTLIVLAAVTAGIFLYVATVRLAYRYELEWLEGVMVSSVGRLLSGDGIYVRPSMGFVPFLYTPLYYYVSAAVAWVAGVSFLPLRIVSVAATAGTAWAILAIVRRDSGSTLAGIVGAAVFLGTYEVSGAWFDLARVDMLFVALLFVAVLLLRRSESLLCLVGASIAMAACYFTKQTALGVFVPLFLWMAVRHRIRGIVAAALTVLLVAAGVLLLHLMTDGWHTYYTFRIPAALRNSLMLEKLELFFIDDLLAPLPIAIGMAGGALWMFVARKQWKRSSFLWAACVRHRRRDALLAAEFGRVRQRHDTAPRGCGGSGGSGVRSTG